MNIEPSLVVNVLFYVVFLFILIRTPFIIWYHYSTIKKCKDRYQKLVSEGKHQIEAIQESHQRYLDLPNSTIMLFKFWVWWLPDFEKEKYLKGEKG